MIDRYQGEKLFSQTLFVDDTTLLAVSADRLQCLVIKFGRVCEGRKLKVSVKKKQS